MATKTTAQPPPPTTTTPNHHNPSKLQLAKPKTNNHHHRLPQGPQPLQIRTPTTQNPITNPLKPNHTRCQSHANSTPLYKTKAYHSKNVEKTHQLGQY